MKIAIYRFKGGIPPIGGNTEREMRRLFTKTLITLSAALVLGASSVTPTMGTKAKVRRHAQQQAPAANVARRPAVLPFTAEEQAMFDRASRVLGAGR
jgi:hypothetical protein